MRESVRRNASVITLVGGLAVFSLSMTSFGSLRLSGLLSSLNVTTSKGEHGLFSHPLGVRGPGSYLEISSDQPLSPKPGEDFLVSTWVKLRSLPQGSERQIFLLKFDGEQSSRPGYGLAFSVNRGAIRPEVYWRDRQGRGGWYLFPSIPLQPDVWCMLALSFREGRYIGLHSSIVNDPLKPEVTLLGGYDVGDVSLPLSSSPLLVGAPPLSNFRGAMGPTFIAAVSGLSDNINEVLNQLVSSPEVVPSLDRLNTSFFLQGGVDIASAQQLHNIKNIRVKIK